VERRRSRWGKGEIDTQIQKKRKKADVCSTKRMDEV
jgi:hypothetical protein